MIAQHDRAVADLHFGVAELAARRVHADLLLRVERLLQKLEHLGAVLKHEVWRHGVIVLRDRLHAWSGRFALLAGHGTGH